MRTHDQEPVMIEGQGALRRKDEEESALVASRALGTNELGTLDAGAVDYLQRTAGNDAVAQLLAGDEETESPVAHVVGSANGRPLDDSVRTLMEGHFGEDLSDVRVHTDSRADESAKSLHAQAYTVGSDIAFRSGNYSPDTQTGQRMLAHELTHVVQQRSGPVDGTPMPGGIKVSDPSDPFELEAERSADAFLAGGPAPTATATTDTAQALVQRQDDEEEELQGLFVQRAPGGGSGDYEDEEGWEEG
ncbi:MAG: DUF4157 domain-containing protein [Acidimicrobiia bacterium]